MRLLRHISGLLSGSSYFAGFLVDEDGLLLDPYHEVAHHHYPTTHHRVPTNPHIVRAESTKSDNSLEEHPLSRNLYRESHNLVPNPHNRENGQYKIVEVDPDSIQVIADVDLQHLPEAVNREILKNSREIVYEEEPRETDLGREERHATQRPLALPKRTHVRYTREQEDERPSLNGSRRNLNNRTCGIQNPEEEKRSLNGLRNMSNKNLPLYEEERRCERSPNGSRRNLHGSKRYLLVMVDKGDALNGSVRNLSVGSRENLVGGRRHTGSRERLNVMKRTVTGVKGSKESPEDRRRRRHEVQVGESNGTHVEIEIEKPPAKRSLALPELISNQRIMATNAPSTDSSEPSNSEIVSGGRLSESVLTPESGFAESYGSSPEIVRKEPKLIGSSVIARNRRSYENAQLQDVNEALTSSSSETESSDSEANSNKESVKLCNPPKKNGGPKAARQTISYTSV